VWPTEDFELVVSHVASQLPEDDLFAGIPRPDGQRPA
jgi:mycothiol S-conjugate amidase